MKIMIPHPHHPMNKALAKALTPEQFALVQDDIKAFMNESFGAARRAGKTTKLKALEATIISKCEAGGLPIFTDV